MESGRRHPERAWTNGSHKRHRGVADPQERDAYVLPTSFGQRRLWFLDHIDPGSALYNICAALRLRGPLHVRSLERALEEIVRRHEVLRTTFVATDGEPMQVVAAVGTLALCKRDLASLADATRAAKVAALIEAEAVRPFDLAGGPLLRCVLLRLGPQDHVLVVVLHHIVADGWSLGVLLGEASRLYAAYTAGLPSPLPELAVQYADYSVWQRQWLQGEVLERELAYWRQQLAGAPPALELPTDRPRPSLQRHRGAQRPVRLGLELTEAVRELSRRQGATVYMTLLAAWQALLSRLTGQTDIAVGTPIAGRTRTETEGLIGFFVNTLVIRTQLEDAPTFAALVGRVRERTLEAYAHQAVPFEKLVEVLAPRRDMSRSPLFQVMFILQNAPVGALRLGTAAVEVMAAETGTAKFDLTLALEETADGLRGWVEYSTDLFEAATIERLVGQYTRLLRAGVAAPDTPITRLPLLSETERTQVLADWNATAAPYPAAPLHALFEAQAERAPDAVALLTDTAAVTYAALEGRANQLANRLRHCGVGPETRVGLLVDRSIDMVVGLLAISKAGGAYVPLDPLSPPTRLAYMLEDAQVHLVVTQASRRGQLSPALCAIALDTDRDAVACERTDRPDSGVTPDNLAYVLHTSGSTGRPKGAMLTHRGIVACLAAMQAIYRLAPSDRFLMKTSLNFDPSVWEVFWPLTVGATVVLARPDGHLDAAYLAEVVERQQVTTAYFVPSMLAAFLDAVGTRGVGSLRQIICGGEKLPVETLRPFFGRVGAELHHSYGPTEASIAACEWTVDRTWSEAAVPMGRPLANMRLYVLDGEMQPLPIGVPGELLIGGDGVGRGYWGRPALTAERFVPDPFGGVPGARLYRTGDRVRWRDDGMAEFLGRIDHQIKLRGFRIELGEIEAALHEHPAVREAAVLLRHDGPEGARLVAYVTTLAAVTSAALRTSLRQRLPDYMVPAVYVIVDELPRTAGGKVDRAALSAPTDADTRTNGGVAPRTPTEQRLAEVWAQVLRRSDIRIDDDFFALGGHSLLATQVVARINDVFDTDLPLRHIFEQPTIVELAALVEAAGAAGGARAPAITRVPRHAVRLPIEAEREV